MLRKLRVWIAGLDALGRLAITLGASIPILTAGAVTIKHLAVDGSKSRPIYETGLRQFKAKDFVSAKASFDVALGDDPTFEDARYHRARSLASLARYDEALDDVLALEKQDPTVDLYFVLGGFIYFSLRDYPRSEYQLDKALSLNPNSVPALFTRAQSLAYQHDYKAASEDLERVIAINPKSRKARFMLTGVYSRDGRVKEATDNCHMLMRLDRRDADYPESCGLVEHRAGNFKIAGYFYRIAQQLNPKLSNIQENIDRADQKMPPVGSPSDLI